MKRILVYAEDDPLVKEFLADRDKLLGRFAALLYHDPTLVWRAAFGDSGLCQKIGLRGRYRRPHPPDVVQLVETLWEYQVLKHKLAHKRLKKDWVYAWIAKEAQEIYPWVTPRSAREILAQHFRFVAKAKLPSYYGNADVQQVYESLIANELGNRQYCMKGWEIVSKKLTPKDDFIVYEGICK